MLPRVGLEETRVATLSQGAGHRQQQDKAGSPGSDQRHRETRTWQAGGRDKDGRELAATRDAGTRQPGEEREGTGREERGSGTRGTGTRRHRVMRWDGADAKRRDAWTDGTDRPAPPRAGRCREPPHLKRSRRRHRSPGGAGADALLYGGGGGGGSAPRPRRCRIPPSAAPPHFCAPLLAGPGLEPGPEPGSSGIGNGTVRPQSADAREVQEPDLGTPGRVSAGVSGLGWGQEWNRDGSSSIPPLSPSRCPPSGARSFLSGSSRSPLPPFDLKALNEASRG